MISPSYEPYMVRHYLLNSKKLNDLFSSFCFRKLVSSRLVRSYLPNEPPFCTSVSMDNEKIQPLKLIRLWKCFHVFNKSNNYLDVPIVVSLPHFLFADPSVISSVDGMHPNEEDHVTFVSVEPVRFYCLIIFVWYVLTS